MQKNKTDLQKILQFLISQYSSHTVILYGSRAGKDFRSNSDYDLLCIRENGQRVREVLTFEQMAIDLIVDNETIFERPLETLYLWQSKILKDEKGFGQKLIEKNHSILSTPPQPMPMNRIHQRKKQIVDELAYIQENSLLGNYRRHDLLVKLRSLYLSLNCLWDLGDKHCFSMMKIKDPQAYNLFEQALKSEASLTEIKTLVEFVVKL